MEDRWLYAIWLWLILTVIAWYISYLIIGWQLGYWFEWNTATLPLLVGVDLGIRALIGAMPFIVGSFIGITVRNVYKELKK